MSADRSHGEVLPKNGEEFTLMMTSRAGRFTPWASPDVVHLGGTEPAFRGGKAYTTARCCSRNSCSISFRSRKSMPEWWKPIPCRTHAADVSSLIMQHALPC